MVVFLCRSVLLEDLALPLLFIKCLLNSASFHLQPVFKTDKVVWFKSSFHVVYGFKVCDIHGLLCSLKRGMDV